MPRAAEVEARVRELEARVAGLERELAVAREDIRLYEARAARERRLEELMEPEATSDSWLADWLVEVAGLARSANVRPYVPGRGNVHLRIEASGAGGFLATEHDERQTLAERDAATRREVTREEIAGLVAGWREWQPSTTVLYAVTQGRVMMAASSSGFEGRL